MGNKGFFFLLNKTIRSSKVSYFFEILSIFVVIVVAIIVLSLMNGVQSTQRDAIKTAESFPFIIKNLSISEARSIQSDIKNKYGYNAYVYYDTPIYSSRSDKLETYVLRCAEYSYYIDNVFLKSFELPPFFSGVPFDNEISISYYTSSSLSNLYFLDKGKSGGVILSPLNTSTVSYYAEKGVFPDPGMIYSVMNDNSLNDGTLVNVGVLLENDSEKNAFKELRNEYNKKDISSYKIERSDIYSALSVERFFLFFVMALILLLILLGLYKTLYSIIKTSRDERILLLAFGKTEKEIFVLYFLALYIPLLLSTLLGTLLGCVLINLNYLSFFMSKYFYINSGGSMFIIKRGEITLLVLFVVVVALLMLVHILKKNCKTVIREVSLDERNY